MGKPFQSELEHLAETISWVSALDLPNTSKLTLDRSYPAFCIGSGGSQSSADFVARLIRMGGGFAWATTPLEFLNLGDMLPRQFSVCVSSAGGGNKDILAAARHAIQNEAVAVSGIIGQSESPLARDINIYARGNVLELDIPAGKDGFLATNSLIASMIAIAGLTVASRDMLPISHLLQTASDVASNPTEFEFRHDDPSIIILYAGWGGSAALDLESKLSESALVPSMLCDLRSFGHGRHHWLAKRAAQTTVVTIEDTQYVDLFSKTLDLLPAAVQIFRIQSPCSGPAASIDLTLRVFGLVRDIGRALGIDPGRPGVPEFGRKIYHLSPGVRSTQEPTAVIRAAARRARQYPSFNFELNSVCEISAAQFIQKLASDKVRAIVFDYDGTLVNTTRRFEPISESIATELTRLLERGIKIGIATGRGKSVRKELRKVLPESTWINVLIGYYNGGQTIPLNEDRLPETAVATNDVLRSVKAVIERDPWFSTSKAAIELRPDQLSLSGATCSNLELWMHVTRLLTGHQDCHLKCLVSSHSIDVVPDTVSKRSLVVDVARLARCPIEGVLRIGDSGLWPGNDSELLADYPSLSCGSSTSDLRSAWNLAPRGVLESEATLYYLKHLLGITELQLVLES